MMTTTLEALDQEVVLSADCEEGDEIITRNVYFAPLTEENIRLFWENLSQFPTLFNRHLYTLENFAEAFVTTVGNEIIPNGIIWKVDDVGMFFLNNIYPSIEATVHITFWDRRLRGREPLCRKMLEYAFGEFEFHRLVARVPLYAMPAIKLAERIGFTKEGRQREATFYKGEWWDVNIYSILRSEVESNGE